MSKVFEGLARRERESGRRPPEIPPPAQLVLDGGGAGRSEVPGAPPSRPAAKAEGVWPASGVTEEEIDLASDARLVYHTEPDSPGADRFRLLRMRLWPVWEAGKLKTLLVTSAHAQDGKSTVVLNLATALAEQGQRRVLVVEADLWHPSLSARLGLPERPGLAECLESGRPPVSLLRRLAPLGWYLLPAGRVNGNATEVLQRPAAAHVFAALRDEFDWILIDTPPAVPLADTLSLSRHADAALLVIRAGRTPGEAVEAAIGSVGEKKLLGIVLNGSMELDRLYSDYRKSRGTGAGIRNAGEPGTGGRRTAGAAGSARLEWLEGNGSEEKGNENES